MKKNKIKYIIVLILSMFLVYYFKDEITILFNDLYNNFSQNFIQENRYLLILKGLRATLIISISSILIGTLIGFLLFLLRKSKIKLLSLLSKIIVNILQGTPVTVLLLIFYYVIFGKINVNPMLVAIITFSIYFSAYISEVFRGAYLSLNKSQIYSAYSLGFTKVQTLRYIIIPQSLSYIIPIFKNESVSLIKSTSIAGYISIMDLTKASDIIRNRTYEPFLPLIVTAIIYYFICLMIGKTLDCLYKKINHKVVKKSEK